jgi:hypothetical protein
LNRLVSVHASLILIMCLRVRLWCFRLGVSVPSRAG